MFVHKPRHQIPKSGIKTTSYLNQFTWRYSQPSFFPHFAGSRNLKSLSRFYTPTRQNPFYPARPSFFTNQQYIMPTIQDNNHHADGISRCSADMAIQKKP